MALALNELKHEGTLPRQKFRGPMKASKRTIVEKIRERIAEKVAANMDPMLDAQIEAAAGTAVNQKGEPLPANTFAFKTLVELAGAGAATKVQHSGAVGIVALVKQLEDNGTDADEE